MAVRTTATTGQNLVRTASLPSAATWTVCGWFRPTTVPNGYTALFALDSNSDIEVLAISDNAFSNTLFFYSDGTHSGRGSTTIAANKWYFFAVARNATSAIVYLLDGTTWTTEITVSTLAAHTPTGMEIGSDNASSGGDASIDGRYAVYKVWDGVKLTLAEIQQEALTIRPQRFANLFGFYPMFPGSGERGRDYSGNGATLSETGSLTDEDPPPVSWGPSFWSLPTAAAGGTTYTSTPTGTLTSAGALVKRTAKLPAGTLTSAGALVKLLARSLAGTVASSGSLAKQTQRALAGSMASAGALVRQCQKAAAGTLTSAGALVKQTSRALTGSMTSTGALVKQTRRALAGTLTSTGALSGIKIALKAISGTLSSSGALVKQTGKAAAGAMTSSGALARATSRMLAGTLAPAGSLFKQTGRALAGTLVSSGALAKQTGKVVAGSLTSSGSLTKQTATALAGVLTFSGNVSKQARKLLAGVLSFLGSLVGVGVGHEPSGSGVVGMRMELYGVGRLEQVYAVSRTEQVYAVSSRMDGI